MTAPVVDYKPFANAVGSNVITQGAYEALLAGALSDGFVAGTAPSNQLNKVWRQSSMVSAAVAQMIASYTGSDVLDNGDLTALTALLTSAIGLAASAGAWSTGDVKLTMKVAADSGWVLCDDGTIGNAASGATTRANADTATLYALLWNNVSNTYAPVSTGRGGSAAADFAANKTIGLTKMLGRVLGVSGAGSGLTSRPLGMTVGSETVVLDTTMIPAHNHVANVTDPTHTHTANVTDTGHTHVVPITDPGHAHGGSDSGHTHGVNDPGHLHANRIVVNGSAIPATQASVPNNSDTLQDTGVSTTGITIASGNANITVASAATGITAAASNHVTGVTVANTASATGITVATTNTGGGLGHANMQPSSFVNAMIKL